MLFRHYVQVGRIIWFPREEHDLSLCCPRDCYPSSPLTDIASYSILNTPLELQINKAGQDSVALDVFEFCGAWSKKTRTANIAVTKYYPGRHAQTWWHLQLCEDTIAMRSPLLGAIFKHFSTTVYSVFLHLFGLVIVVNLTDANALPSLFLPPSRSGKLLPTEQLPINIMAKSVIWSRKTSLLCLEQGKNPSRTLPSNRPSLGLFEKYPR